MKIDLTNIIYNYSESVEINELYSFGEEYLDDTNIDRLDDVKITGRVVRVDDDTFSMKVGATGYMWFLDKTYEFSFEIDEVLTDNDELAQEFIKISDNTIDILPIIWQNIVMEIPL